MQALVRQFAPSPGDIKVFKEKRRMKDYHFYYFQYTSLFHAIVGCFAGKVHFKVNFILDPVILYYGGYRYDQPNHLYHNLLICHAFAYFTYDSIIEIYYGTDDLLTNLHHVVVVVSTAFFFFNKFGGYEYIGMKIHALLNSFAFNG